MKIKSLNTENVTEHISYGLICLGMIDLELPYRNLSSGDGLVVDVEVSEEKSFDLYLTQIGVLGKYIILADLTNIPDEIILGGIKELKDELKTELYKNLLQDSFVKSSPGISSTDTIWTGPSPYTLTNPYQYGLDGVSSWGSLNSVANYVAKC